MMETPKHWCCDDLSCLGASMRRRCRQCAGRTLSNRTMRPPVIEIAHILGQNLRQMALIEDEDVVQALGPDRSHPALGDGVGPRRSERRASLGNTETTHPPIEAGAITVVAVINEKAWRLVVPTAARITILRPSPRFAWRGPQETPFSRGGTVGSGQVAPQLWQRRQTLIFSTYAPQPA